ncbi:pentatricopeptide repeat-containing protein At1g74850, chloroplastic isoform X1 [Cynara cardunculus var. scolymus]|uniref:pentatricopeptide repeat-containing protein At1g74850, chloroplastic isoform X1 n=1 Tax=Cynara cardunculus var. scolymus TaxID=59895 RepID=UPI000D62D0F0|nr:pentatricopeptide repeat-containing protein At1g74850, chloroplastic isoform X1 [Cynara cardunculus var. scolymus]
MTLSYHHSISPILIRSTNKPTIQVYSFPQFTTRGFKFSGRRSIVICESSVAKPPGSRSRTRSKPKPKELVFGYPSSSVEKGKYSYEVESLLNKLSSLPPRGSVARCLEPFKNKLSLNDFALVFKELAQRGDWQRSLRLFKQMQRQVWSKPNDHIYTIVIGILGREGLLDKCSEVFDEMPSDGVPRSVFSYTSIINAYGRNGQYEISLQLLDRMKKERIPPNNLTYNTVINSCARGGYEWEGLLSIFAEMRHEGLQPDLVTYNTLLAACANRGLGDEAVMVFRSMNEGGTIPDTTSYDYLVQTFGKLGNLSKVSELLREMESRGNLPEASCYNVLLEAYSDLEQIKEAMDVFRQMQTAGCVANAMTYTILLNLFGRQGRYDEVRELFLEMKVSSMGLDAGTYNILIDVFGEGGYFKEVITLFNDMVEEKIEPNMETYEGLIVACGKGGLHEDAKRILLHMRQNGLVPSPKAYTGIVEAYGQAALYEEALVTFNTMNELGSIPTVETFNSLIDVFARGGLYKESEAIVSRMDESGVSGDKDTFNSVIEAFRQAGQFEDAIKAYVDMEKAKCNPDERTLEAVLSVYCFAGLVDESEEQFQEIEKMVVLPSVMSYCMMLAIYAKNERWDDAYKLLHEMIKCDSSNVHQVIGQMIRGDYDDASNWQMVEYVFDKLNTEGRGLGLRFYNALLEALWWLGQKERATRVLKEATKRGLLPEIFRNNKRVWSVDVHRLWPGGACAAISVWFEDMYQKLVDGEDLPHLASVVVVRRGQMEKSSITRDFPVAKITYSLLKDGVSSSFCLPGWNKGRIVCQQAQLKRILGDMESGSEKLGIISLSNSPIPVLESRTNKAKKKKGSMKEEVKGGGINGGTNIDTRTELVTGSI